jgi:nucleoside-diphosphate-sugar epimerase
MKIAVTGGSGFIGNHLVAKLVSEGHKVKVLVRKTSNITILKELPIKLVIGDIRNRESVESLVNGVEVVYHVAAQVYSGSTDEFWNVNLQGTENMLKACLNRGINKFVHISSVGVTGNIENPPANESHPYNPTFPYDRSKCEAEKLAVRYNLEHKMPITIIRPTAVYGPRHHLFSRFYQAVQKGIFPFIGSMKNLIHLCYIDNLMQGIMLAADKRESVGEIYIIGDEKPVTWIEHIKTIAEVIGVNPPSLHVPLSIMKVITYLSEFKSWMFGGEPLLTQRWLEEITKNFAYDITKAKKALGYNPKISLKEGIIRTVKWYRQNGFLN